MIAGFLLIAQMVFAAPVLTVQWSGPNPAVDIRLNGPDENILQCINGGLDVRFRYEMKICSRDDFWFDECTDRYRETRSIAFDPVTENFQLITDIHQDEERPRSWVEDNLEDALKAVTQFSDFQLSRLGPEVGEILSRRKPYLSIQARVYCQENEESLTTRIPYYLTLGIFRFTGLESGWVDFSLER